MASENCEFNALRTPYSSSSDMLPSHMCVCNVHMAVPWLLLLTLFFFVSLLCEICNLLNASHIHAIHTNTARELYCMRFTVGKVSKLHTHMHTSYRSKCSSPSLRLTHSVFTLLLLFLFQRWDKLWTFQRQMKPIYAYLVHHMAFAHNCQRIVLVLLHGCTIPIYGNGILLSQYVLTFVVRLAFCNDIYHCGKCIDCVFTMRTLTLCFRCSLVDFIMHSDHFQCNRSNFSTTKKRAWENRSSCMVVFIVLLS